MATPSPSARREGLKRDRSHIAITVVSTRATKGDIDAGTIEGLRPEARRQHPAEPVSAGRTHSDGLGSRPSPKRAVGSGKFEANRKARGIPKASHGPPEAPAPVRGPGGS
uniref:Uncharacterized protein n=1 Tax=Oryza glumipatula TaxID=40148 RepID=A0A0E0BNG6_9ORYZ